MISTIMFFPRAALEYFFLKKKKSYYFFYFIPVYKSIIQWISRQGRIQEAWGGSSPLPRKLGDDLWKTHKNTCFFIGRSTKVIFFLWWLKVDQGVLPLVVWPLKIHLFFNVSSLKKRTTNFQGEVLKSTYKSFYLHVKLYMLKNTPDYSTL